MDITIALYSHDSVGLGHARRNRALAYALAEHLPALTGRSVRGLLIAGHPEAGRDSLPAGWDWLVLPGVTTGTDGYIPRHLDATAAELCAVRGATADAALTVLRPDLFIVDRHPFGVNEELTAVLRRLRDSGCRTVLGLREVLDTPRVAIQEWDRVGGAERVARYFDQIWVYGDAMVYDPRRTGEIPPAMARLAALTGYLANGRPAAPEHRPCSETDPYVLTVLGGGSDGVDLARCAVRATVPDGHRHLLVTGPQMPTEQISELRELAGPTTEVRRTAPDVPELIAEASAVVCMGGYNTIAEVLVTSTPALVVPRTSRRDEQPRRARALAALGAVDTDRVEHLTPASLGGWLRAAVTSRTDRRALALDGLSRVPVLAAELLHARIPSRSSSRAVQFTEVHGHAG